MSVLDITYKDAVVGDASKPDKKIWCDEDRHNLFEYFTDFNEWIDGEDGLDLRLKYKIDGLNSPSKALFASDNEAYNQAFKDFHSGRISQVLCQEYIVDLCGDGHWFERNCERFGQLVNCLKENSVVPFIGAGLSVNAGFPTWKHHLQQQGRTSGIDPNHINDLLAEGKYEQVIEEIENLGHHDVFVQEIKDVFSKNGKITDTSLRLTELFRDTLITTNYDHVIELSYETGEQDRIQVIDCTNILEDPIEGRVTVIKLHGDVRSTNRCILSKQQYDDAYGDGILDLSKPIPKLLDYYYKNSSLLFLGCSLNHDRTMQVFQAVKKAMGDMDRPQHFSFESMPDTEEKLRDRNAYLLNFGITPIWFPKGSYDSIEMILRCARNELRYDGF
jgi:NAD-dependent SIR2 family protein deacetylase